MQTSVILDAIKKKRDRVGAGPLDRTLTLVDSSRGMFDVTVITNPRYGQSISPKACGVLFSATMDSLLKHNSMDCDAVPMMMHVGSSKDVVVHQIAPGEAIRIFDPHDTEIGDLIAVE